MRKLKSALIALLLGLTTFVVVGAALLALFLPTLLQRFGCAPYGIRCAVGPVSIRPRPNLTADLVIDHLTLFDLDGRGVALRVKRLSATLNIPALILTRQVLPTEVRIESPELLLKQLDDGRWNLVALAQEIRQHLRSTTDVAPVSLPRISLTGGSLQTGDRQVTDLSLSLEPKPAPLLFEGQARAVVGGRSIQISGALRNTLEGQILAQVQEAMLRGVLRFHLDQTNRAVSIPEWSFEADGAMARGTAAVRYANWPPTYTLTVAEWRADLAALAQHLSFPWLSDLTGMVDGEPTTLQGHWLKLPVGEVTATLRSGGLELAAPRFGVTGLSGRISFSLPDGGRPWKAEMMSRSLQLHTAAMNDAATLHAAQIAVQGVGMSGRHLEGTLAIGQADLAGRPLRALRAELEIDPDQIRIPEFHVVAAGGVIDGHASLSRAAPLQEARVALSVRGLRPQSLFAPVEKPTEAHGVTLDADLSADATFGRSQSLTSGGTMTLRGLSISLARQAAEPVPLLTGIRGAIAFTLDRGLLTIKETALRADGDLTLILTGSLPLGHNDRSATRIHLTVPWTEVAALRSPLAALTGGQPDATRFAGQLQANLELIGQEYHGALSLRHVSIESNGFHLNSASGMIPLHGRIDQSQTSPLHKVATQQRAGWSHPTEREYRTALERLSNVPARAPFSLTISSLAYDPIELRNVEIVLASSENQIAVQRFAFDASGGRWSGWGTVEPLGGGIALTLLTEGLSLRAICDAFPPIKGYISGRINGMADLVVPRFTIDQAHGSARFWAVDSPQEKRKISRTLIEQLAGQQIRYFSLFGVARRYNRGTLEVALKAGDLSFHELEISHTILGYKDLNVRVSPTFNKIGLTHLLESISEAIERIRSSAKPQDKT